MTANDVLMNAPPFKSYIFDMNIGVSIL